MLLNIVDRLCCEKNKETKFKMELDEVILHRKRTKNKINKQNKSKCNARQ